jgi:hypothetical protein
MAEFRERKCNAHSKRIGIKMHLTGNVEDIALL